MKVSILSGPKAKRSKKGLSSSTVPSKLLIILIKAKLCIPSLQKETVFKQFKICVMKSCLADQCLNPRLFYRNVFGIFAGWRPNCKHRSWSFATCTTLAWWPGQSYYGWDTNLHFFQTYSSRFLNPNYLFEILNIPHASTKLFWVDPRNLITKRALSCSFRKLS